VGIRQAPGNDSTAYFDASKSVCVVFPNLKATTTSISLRLHDTLLTHIKAMANSALPVVDEPKQVPHFL
jgi:hypothetical protein